MTSVAPGTILAGKYRVTKVIGEGGMGVVVAAVHLQLDELVAIKFMLPTVLENAEAVARFLREARAAVRLKSEHVARVSDVGTLEAGAPYIVMEYLEGTDLSALLNARGPLSPDDAVDYVVQACDAVAEAHALGIVHRDLKPANLFLTRRRDGSPLVKVLDFGISKSSPLNEAGHTGQASESLTKTGGVMGSPVYMSPEQMKSAKDADGRSDVWALGVILYELIGGRRPFESDTLGGLMAKVLTETPPPIASVRPGLPPALVAAIATCLEKEREKRFSSIAELASALRSVAPRRAQPLIERISGVLADDPSRGIAAPSGAHRAAPSSSLTVRSGLPSVTAPAWTEASAAQAPRSKRAKGLAIAAVAAVVIAGVGTAEVRRATRPAATVVPTASDVTEVTGGTAETPALEDAPRAHSLPPRVAPPPLASAPAPTAALSPVPQVPDGAHRSTPKDLPALGGAHKKRAAEQLPVPATQPSPHPSPHPAPAKPAADLLDTSN